LEGKSEKLLGQFIREYQGGKGAKDVLIATKLAPYPFRIGKGSIIDATRQSIKRLDRGMVDIGQLHWAPPLGWQEKAYWEGFAELYRNNEIRAIGLSNYGPKKLAQAQEFIRSQGAELSSNQVQFSLVSTLPEKSGLLDAAKGLGVRLIAYSPLGLGLLTGRYTEERLPQGPRRVLFKELLPELRPVLQTMEEIKTTRKGGVTYSQIALNWCRAKGTIPIVGLKNVVQAKENLGALSWRLSSSEVEALDRAVKGMKKQTLQNIFQSE